MNLGGAATGAAKVGHHQQHDLEEMLQQAFRQKQIEQEMALRAQMEQRATAADATRAQMSMAQMAQDQSQHKEVMGLRNRDFDADQAARAQQAERVSAADRQVENQRGVRRMIGDFITQRGAQPLDTGSRQTLTGMAIQEDVDLPKAITDDPAAENAEWERRQAIEQKNRMQVVGAQGANTLAAAQTRSSNASGGNPEEALDTAREVQRIARALRDSKGRSGAFGVLQSRLPTIRQDTADAEVLLNSLRSLLTLENTGKLKGVLSNADMELLRQASSTLAAQMSDPAAVAELNRLGQVMSRATGEQWDAPQAPAAAPQHGGARAAGAGPVKWGRDAQGRPVQLR
jgi:hypothetical protein